MEVTKEISLIFEDANDMVVSPGTTVREVLNKINDGEVIALRINGEAVPADAEIVEDCYVNYIKVTDRIGQKIYMKGLEYVYINAIKDLYGSKSKVYIKHSLDKGIYTELDIKKDVDKSVIASIKKRMIEISNFVGKNPYLYKISSIEATDIDTELDFEIAEYLFKKYNGGD